MSEIRPHAASDNVPLSHFLETYFPQRPGAAVPRSRTAAYYQWKYDNNPFGASIVYHYWDRGEILGTFGAVAVPALVRGAKTIVYQICDSFVAPELQGKGIYTRLMRNVIEGLDRVCRLSYATSPTPKNWEALSYKHRYYPAFFFSQIVSILQPDKLLEAKGFAALSAPFRLGSALLKGTVKKKGFVLEAVPDLKSCCTLGPTRNSDFSLHRTSEYITYRYEACPEPYQFFLAKMGSLKTLLVVKIVNLKHTRICYLVDVMEDFDQPRQPFFWLGALQSIGIETDCGAVSIETHLDELRGLKANFAGFFIRRKRQIFMVRQKEFDFLNPRSREFDKTRWVFFTGDGDNL